MRVAWSCGATATSRTRPLTAPLASRTDAPMSSDSATRDIANPAVSRATADSVNTDVKLEFPVLNIRVRGCWLAALWLAGGCGSLPASSTTTLAVPGRANANVSITAEGEFVAATWSAAEPGGSMDIYLSVSADGGKRFVAPVRVNRHARRGTRQRRTAAAPRSGSTRRRTAVDRCRLDGQRDRRHRAAEVAVRRRRPDIQRVDARAGHRCAGQPRVARGRGPTPRVTSTSCGSITGGLRRIRRSKTPTGMVPWLSRAATPSGMAQFSDLYSATLDRPGLSRAADRRRVLLLQDGHRPRPRRSDAPCVAACLPRKSSRHCVHDTDGGRGDRHTGARQRGSVDAAGLSGRRPGHGRRRQRPRARRVADRGHE